MNNRIVKRTVIYEALFVTEYEDCIGESIEVHKETPFRHTKLSNPISYPHVTVAYKPAIAHKDFYNALVNVIVKGYGNDGINEGYLVELIPRPWNDVRDYTEFCKLLSEINVPHITLSVSDEGKPIDTCKLEFVDLPMDEQRVLECRFGAFVETEYVDGKKDTGYTFYGFELE